MKKAMVLLLAGLMALALTVPAMADGENGFTVTEQTNENGGSVTVITDQEGNAFTIEDAPAFEDEVDLEEEEQVDAITEPEPEPTPEEVQKEIEPQTSTEDPIQSARSNAWIYIVLAVVVGMIGDLFDEIKTIFGLSW